MAASRRGVGLSTKSFCYISGRSLDFLLPSAFGGNKFPSSIEITSGKAFRLFSEHRKSSIIIIKFVFIERKKKE